jgi:type IV secretory pathway VirB10-like protein
MKRCPQCEFIYEDDQSLCDMDGVLLVFDSRTLPNEHALATVPAKPRQRRSRAVPAFATVILAGVLGMVYYVSTQPNAAPVTEIPASAATTVSNPTPESIPTPEPPPPAEEKAEAVAKPATSAPLKKPVAKPVSNSQTKPATVKKDDSKVGSILKKTGRILKKPFKL